ncbi:hypothetical protein C8R44DRAFT_744224 [Mycena epipterygia]|nr:hypothetical protein C8R44DRAFT_744224 [Mycena epipterygia]
MYGEGQKVELLKDWKRGTWVALTIVKEERRGWRYRQGKKEFWPCNRSTPEVALHRALPNSALLWGSDGLDRLIVTLVHIINKECTTLDTAETPESSAYRIYERIAKKLRRREIRGIHPSAWRSPVFAVVTVERRRNGAKGGIVRTRHPLGRRRIFRSEPREALEEAQVTRLQASEGQQTERPWALGREVHQHTGLEPGSSSGRYHPKEIWETSEKSEKSSDPISDDLRRLESKPRKGQDTVAP